jgi:hypothetical protein
MESETNVVVEHGRAGCLYREHRSFTRTLYPAKDPFPARRLEPFIINISYRSGVWAVSARGRQLWPGGHNAHTAPPRPQSSGSGPDISINVVAACPSSSVAQHVGKPSPVYHQQLDAATSATQASEPLRQWHLDPSGRPPTTPTPRGSGQRCRLRSRRRCEQRGAGDAGHRRP